MRIFSAAFAALAIGLPVLLLSPVGARAQGPGAGEPRALPPAPPAKAAEQPGEAPAMKAPATPETAAPADNRSREAASRCAELAGAAREQCLLEQQGSASGGATSAPEPRPAPPPQNPR